MGALVFLVHTLYPSCPTPPVLNPGGQLQMLTPLFGWEGSAFGLAHVLHVYTCMDSCMPTYAQTIKLSVD